MSRFQADPDQLIQQISTFGKINSISHTYTAWCAGQVIVSPAMITSVSTGPVPPSSSATTTTTPAETASVSVAQLTGKDEGRKKMEQEKAATNPASVSKHQQHLGRKDPSPPTPPEPCAPDELLARQERVKASLLAQGVILYPPAGELAPSKKSARKDRKRRSAQRLQDSDPGEDGGAKETVNPPNTKLQTSSNDKPAPMVSRPQASAKLESAATTNAPAEKTNEKKGDGPASGQGPKVLPPSRDNQKATSAPQSRPKGAHYEQSVIIVHTKPRGGRGQRPRQQAQHPRPAPDTNRGGQVRQQREDRRRAVKPSKQQPAPTPATNGSEEGPSAVEEPQKQEEEAAIPEKMSDPGSKPEDGSATSPSSPLVGQTAPEHADLPGVEGKAAVEVQSEEIAFMDTSSAEPGGEETSTRKQLLRVTPSPDLSETPLSEEEVPEESFQLKDDLTSEPQTGED